MTTLPLIVRDKNDKPIRRFRYSENAARFMFTDLVYTKGGVLTLTHQLGMTLATAKLSPSGLFTFQVHDDQLYSCFKS